MADLMREKRMKIARDALAESPGKPAYGGVSKPGTRAGAHLGGIQRSTFDPDIAGEEDREMKKSAAVAQATDPHEVDDTYLNPYDLPPEEWNIMRYRTPAARAYFAHLDRIPEYRREWAGRHYAGLTKPPVLADPADQAEIAQLIDRGSHGDVRPEMAELQAQEAEFKRMAEEQKAALEDAAFIKEYYGEQ